MSKILVSYFSASGVTRGVAEKIKEELGADLFEIEPVEKYTQEDLDWNDKESRSSIEMNNLSYRPAINKKVDNINDYDVVLIGYPIWWYIAPTIINTFIEENNLEGKKIYLFATSGSSGIENSREVLEKAYPNLKIVNAKRFNRIENSEEYKNWIM